MNVGECVDRGGRVYSFFFWLQYFSVPLRIWHSKRSAIDKPIRCLFFFFSRDEHSCRAVIISHSAETYTVWPSKKDDSKFSVKLKAVANCSAAATNPPRIMALVKRVEHQCGRARTVAYRLYRYLRHTTAPPTFPRPYVCKVRRCGGVAK